MAPLNEAEMEELVFRILKDLSETPYACSELMHLTSGTTNFVFRGSLLCPLSSSARHFPQNFVIVKHSTAFAAVNKDFPLDVTRSQFEETMLHALGHFTSIATVQTPRLYLFNRTTNTQVIEYFPGVIELKSLLASSDVSEPTARSIGHDLGKWLKAFHDWASAPDQKGLRIEIEKNRIMRHLKYQITYARFIDVLQKFPELIEGHGKALREIQEMAFKDFKKTPSEDDGDDWGLIHGDFWSANVLLPPSPRMETKGSTSLLVIDWEYAQYGRREYDIGNMIGDLIERWHFGRLHSFVWAIQGFVKGYGGIGDEMAFRTAIYAGVHLINWYNRGPSKPNNDETLSALRLGRDLVVKGWEKDRTWLLSSVLEHLFQTT
ncbi:hypothetical protein JX266_001852 [Neoarthrinium moseri]|nr:hypothetical protein JX266_001852 [Neoarthrinium moseri]